MTSDPTKLSAVHTIPQSLLINVLGISYELWLTISLQKIECPMLLYKNASLLLEPLCRQVVGTWWCIMLRVEYYVGSHYEVRHFSSCLMGNPRHFMITQRQQQQSLQCLVQKIGKDTILREISSAQLLENLNIHLS